MPAGTSAIRARRSGSDRPRDLCHGAPGVRNAHDSKYDVELGQRRAWFHWILGLAIIGMLAYGWWMNHIPARPDRFFHRSIHADIGYLVLLLMVLRLIWRGVNPTPALPSDTPRGSGSRRASATGALYLVTILVAMLGWAHSGARTPNYASCFGLFSVPQFTSPDKASGRHLRELAHLTWPMCLLASDRDPHRAAAWHHFIRRDRVAARMLDGAPG